MGSSFGTKSILPRQNIASHPKKSSAISFRTTAQESDLYIIAVITIHRTSNYYRKNSTWKCPLLVLFLLKILYFRRKHIEKHTFPLVIATFLLYLQRILLKSCITMIIGRENEQRKLCKLLGSSMQITLRV